MNASTTKRESVREQRIVDARMEYGLLMSSYSSLAQMMWVGYGAFFTLNTLLATALGFSYSPGSAALGSWLLKIVHLAIPITGIAVSAIAIYAAIEIRGMMRLTNDRGRELEQLLHAEIFSRTQQYSRKPPAATIVGSSLFLVVWLAVLKSAVA